MTPHLTPEQAQLLKRIAQGNPPEPDPLTTAIIANQKEQARLAAALSSRKHQAGTTRFLLPPSSVLPPLG